MESFHSSLLPVEEHAAPREVPEVILIEDPVCSWCWAYQPVETAFIYEYAGLVRFRRVVAGLRDFAVPSAEFANEQWRVAAEISGMPMALDDFDPSSVETTWVACRVVKAAQILEPERAGRLLRRLREELFVHGARIDDLEVALDIAAREDLDRDRLGDYVRGGRADPHFARDRKIASEHGFGLPTLVVRRGTPDETAPLTLDGVVSYAEVTSALGEAGVSLRRRRRFLDRPEDWDRLFRLRPRIAMAEIETVTQLSAAEIRERLSARGLEAGGAWIDTRERARPQPQAQAGAQARAQARPEPARRAAAAAFA